VNPQFIYIHSLKQSSRFFLLVILILCSIQLNAQSSVVAAGKDIENTNGSVSFTVGSLFYLSRNQSLSITEGIQQSYTINEIPGKSTLRVFLFPNPTSDLVYFKVENLNYKNLSYRVYDLSGRLMSEGKIINPQSSVSVSYTHLTLPTNVP
jgi:hypothetical protein